MMSDSGELVGGDSSKEGEGRERGGRGRRGGRRGRRVEGEGVEMQIIIPIGSHIPILYTVIPTYQYLILERRRWSGNWSCDVH